MTLDKVPLFAKRFLLLKISSGISWYLQALGNIQTPKIVLFAALKSASMSRIDLSLVIREHPKIFSRMTERP